VGAISCLPRLAAILAGTGDQQHAAGGEVQAVHGVQRNLDLFAQAIHQVLMRRGGSGAQRNSAS
jgi:hypothetical protein